MSRELWCTICSRFVDVDSMTLVQDFKNGGRGHHKGRSRGCNTVATFYDRKHHLVHVVLNEEQSAFRKPTPQPEPEVMVVKPEPSQSALPPVAEAPSPPELLEQWQAEHEQETTQEAEQLWQQEVAPEPWEPNEDEWYAARIHSAREGQFAFGFLSNGQHVYIPKTVCQPRARKLVVGDNVVIRLTRNVKNGAEWMALECDFDLPEGEEHELQQ